MELIPIAGLLMNAPRAVSAAMDLTNKIRKRDNDKVDLTERVQELEQDVQSTVGLVAQNAQAINALAVRLDATSRRVRMLTAATGASGLIAIAALVAAVAL